MEFCRENRGFAHSCSSLFPLPLCDSLVSAGAASLSGRERDFQMHQLVILKCRWPGQSAPGVLKIKSLGARPVARLCCWPIVLLDGAGSAGNRAPPPAMHLGEELRAPGGFRVQFDAVRAGQYWDTLSGLSDEAGGRIDLARGADREEKIAPGQRRCAASARAARRTRPHWAAAAPRSRRPDSGCAVRCPAARH